MPSPKSLSQSARTSTPESKSRDIWVLQVEVKWETLEHQIGPWTFKVPPVMGSSGCMLVFDSRIAAEATARKLGDPLSTITLMHTTNTWRIP